MKIELWEVAQLKDIIKIWIRKRIQETQVLRILLQIIYYEKYTSVMAGVSSISYQFGADNSVRNTRATKTTQDDLKNLNYTIWMVPLNTQKFKEILERKNTYIIFVFSYLLSTT